MTFHRNTGSISAADEVAAAEANLKAAQERLNAARQRYTQEAYTQPMDAASGNSSPYAQQAPSCVFGTSCIKPTKDHITAGVLAIIFGAFGIHKFYMGYANTGFVVLAVTIIGSLLTFGAAALVMQLIGVVEGIIYLIKTQSQFEQDYVREKRKWL